MENTKNRILNAAEGLVQQVGPNAMSYQQVSDAVGVRKASIHHHFPKKENLVEALLMRCHVIYGDRYKEIINGSGAAPEKLRQLATVFAGGLETQQLCMVGTISADINSLQERSRQILDKTISETVALYATVFEQGQQEGSLVVGEPAKEIAYGFFSMLVGAQIAARACGGVATFNRATEAVISGWEK